MDLVEGKKIFSNRREYEYPLPARVGTRDYIFYFVSEGDKYGKGARNFFNKFYKKHQSKNVDSLEEIINHLANEVNGQGITNIREIVIVTHGNAQGLIFPVVDGVSGTSNKKYKYLTAGSLASLQQDFTGGQFSNFFTKRKKVVDKLTETSWITVRACNFGQSKLGMYALYAFFGGRANVYCPKVFQFFGSHPIMDGMRLETKLEVHQHLVKQRFLSKDTLVKDRKKAIAQSILSCRAHFSESNDLISVDQSNPTSPESLEYKRIVDELNQRRLDAELVALLSDNGITLTNRKRVIVMKKGSEWMVRDRLLLEEKKYIVEHHLSEVISIPNSTLQVASRIADMHGAAECFPLQLFFYNGDNDLWRGKLFVLSSYTDEPDADPVQKAQFDAVLALLDAPVIDDTGGSLLITQKFEEEGYKLSPPNPLALLSTTGSGSNLRKTWRLNDTTSYLIKLEHPATTRGFPAHTLIVYENPSERDALTREYELMSFIGTDPDQPGPELMSYLDNLSFDELTKLIDYLRNPYKAENVIYIYYAIQAIQNKKGSIPWLMNLPEAEEGINDPLWPIGFKWNDLDYSEREDRRIAVYEFEAYLFWAEVKASNPPTQQFQSDLFTEQPFTFTTTPLTENDHLEPDSPSTDIEELRAMQSQGFEKFFSMEKFTLDESIEDPKNMSCGQFSQFITLIQELEGKSESEIEEALNDVDLFGEPSLIKYYVIPKPIIWAKNFWDATAPKAKVALLEKGINALVSKYPTLTIGTTGRIATIGRFYARNSAAIGLYGLVYEMFANFLKAQSNTLTVWEQTGKLTAIRQYARRLRSMSFTLEENFPTTISIDIGENVIKSYFREQLDEDGVFFQFIFGPDRMKKGFDEGKVLIEKEVNEVLSRTDRIVNDAMRQKGFGSCKIKVFRDAGFVDPSRSRAMIMRSYADSILRGLPKV